MAGSGGVAGTSTVGGTLSALGDLEDDDSALDPSEQTNRPVDDALRQQRVQAWHPILDPLWVIVALFYLGVILVPTGTFETTNTECTTCCCSIRLSGIAIIFFVDSSFLAILNVVSRFLMFRVLTIINIIQLKRNKN